MFFKKDENKPKKEKKIPRVKWFSDHESFHANYIGYMSLAMALCQIPYIMVIYLLILAKKHDPVFACISFIFVIFIVAMLWFGITRADKIEAMPQDDRAVVVKQRDVYMRQLLRMQTLSFATLIILFGVSLL